MADQADQADSKQAKNAIPYLLTTGQVARFLGRNRRTVATWTERDGLPCQRVGGYKRQRRIDPHQLAAFLLVEGVPIPAELQRLLEDLVP